MQTKNPMKVRTSYFFDIYTCHFNFEAKFLGNPTEKIFFALHIESSEFYITIIMYFHYSSLFSRHMGSSSIYTIYYTHTYLFFYERSPKLFNINRSWASTPIKTNNMPPTLPHMLWYSVQSLGSTGGVGIYILYYNNIFSFFYIQSDQSETDIFAEIWDGLELNRPVDYFVGGGREICLQNETVKLNGIRLIKNMVAYRNIRCT